MRCSHPALALLLAVCISAAAEQANMVLVPALVMVVALVYALRRRKRQGMSQLKREGST